MKEPYCLFDIGRLEFPPQDVVDSAKLRPHEVCVGQLWIVERSGDDLLGSLVHGIEFCKQRTIIPRRIHQDISRVPGFDVDRA